MSAFKSFLRSDLVILGAGKLLQILLLFIAVRLFTTYLPDNEIGHLILIISVASFFGMALINPVGSFINRKLNSWKDEGTIASNFLAFNYYVLAVSMLTLLVPALLAVAGVGESIDTFYFSLLLFLFVYFNTWNQTVIPALNLLYYRKAFVIFTLVSVVLYLMFSSAFVLSYEPTALFWFSGQIGGLIIGFLLALAYFYKRLLGKESLTLSPLKWGAIKGVSSFSLPLAAATLLFWVLGNSYKLIIEGALSAEDLAYIGLGLGLATSLAGAVESLIMQVFHAPFYKGLAQCQTQQERSRLFQSFINNTIPVIGGALFVLIAVSPFLLSILADSRFLSAYIFLMAGLFIEFLRVSTNVLSHAAHSEYQTHRNITPYLWGAMIASLASFSAVYSVYWQWLVILSLTLSWVVTLVLMLRSARRLLSFCFPWLALARLIVTLLPVAVVAYALWGKAQSILVSLLFSSVAGLYLALIVFRQYRRRGVDV